MRNLIKSKGGLNKENLLIILMIFSLIMIPLPHVYTSISFILLVVVWGYYFLLTKRYKNINYSLSYTLLPVLIGLFYCLSYFWSIEPSVTLEVIKTKIPLIVYPIILLNFPKISPKKTKYIFCCLIFAIALVDIWIITKSYQHYRIYRDLEIFFYHNLSNQIDLNAIYLSAFNAITIFILIFKKNIFNSHNFRLVLIVFFCFTTFLLSSKMIIFTCFFSIFISNFFLNQNKIKFIIKYSLIAITISIAAINTKVFSQRVNKLFQTDIEKIWTSNNFNNLVVDGISIRILQYKLFFEIIKEEPSKFLFGYGLGAHKQKLNEKYLQFNIISKTKEFDTIQGLDFHNQYLCTFMSIGLIGFTLLISFFVRFLFNSIKKQQILQISVCVFWMLVFLTEMYLERQRGVMFFLTTMYIVHITSNKQNDEVSYIRH